MYMHCKHAVQGRVPVSCLTAHGVRPLPTGDTWGAARLLPIVGTTCEGSIGRDITSPAGRVLLAAPDGPVPFRLNRGNISVWTLDMAAVGAAPVSRVDVWPDAGGYSYWAQARSGQMLLLYEAGGTVYDYGIKISRVDANSKWRLGAW